MTLTLVANRRHRPPARAADGGVVVLPLLAEEGWQRGAHTYAAPTPACIPARRNLPRPHTHTSARNIALSLPLTLTRPSPSANPRPSRRPTATGVPRRRRRPSRRQRWSEPCCDLTLLLFYTDSVRSSRGGPHQRTGFGGRCAYFANQGWKALGEVGLDVTTQTLRLWQDGFPISIEV